MNDCKLMYAWLVQTQVKDSDPRKAQLLDGIERLCRPEITGKPGQDYVTTSSHHDGTLLFTVCNLITLIEYAVMRGFYFGEFTTEFNGDDHPAGKTGMGKEFVTLYISKDKPGEVQADDNNRIQEADSTMQEVMNHE